MATRAAARMASSAANSSDEGRGSQQAGGAPKRQLLPSGSAAIMHNDAASAETSASEDAATQKAARCAALGRRNAKTARIATATGVVQQQAHTLTHAFPKTQSQTDSFKEVRAVVFSNMVPNAAQTFVGERAGWKDESYRISDVPPGLERRKCNMVSIANRRGYTLPPGSAIAAALDERLKTLRAKLGVQMVSRVGLCSEVSAKPVVRQFGHYDFAQYPSSYWARQNGSRPWTLLVSMMDGGALNVWSHGRWVAVHLDAGDGILFDAFTWHSGASYSQTHWRLHEYWEPLESSDYEFRRDEPGGELALHGCESKSSYLDSQFCAPSVTYVGKRHDFSEYLASGCVGIDELAFK